MLDNVEKMASIFILTYNNKDDLDECLRSIMDQAYTNYEIIIIDNSSTDGTVDLVRLSYPGIKLIETGSNLGYASGNNTGLKYARGEYIVVVNPDTVADANWLRELIKPLDDHTRVSTSKVLMYGDRDRINTCANNSHFTGLGFCRGLYKNSKEFLNRDEVSAVSGCSFAIARDAFESLGGFDSDFFLYLEDTDLSWRARLKGYKLVYVPTSIIYHKFKLSITPWKEYYLERNRYMMLFKNYRVKTLVLIFPALVVTELITWTHALLHGLPYVNNKLKAYIWVIANLGKIIDKRRRMRSDREISDRELFLLLDWKIPFEQVIESMYVRYIVDTVFNSFFRIYYRSIISLI
jgi:GT2 family glycosyltransferase